MTRTSLDRFAYGPADPQDREPETVCCCAFCGEALRVGDEVLEDESGERFCDSYCYLNWLGDKGVIRWETLCPEA